MGGRGFARAGLAGAGFARAGLAGAGFAGAGSTVCRCTSCGYSEPHARGIPCYTRACPMCGARMLGTNCYPYFSNY
jgi:hypothetical protein